MQYTITVFRTVESHNGARGNILAPNVFARPLWGEILKNIFKMVHSGVLYIFQRRHQMLRDPG